MTAKELINKLDTLVQKYGDKDILIRDPAFGSFDTAGDIKIVVMYPNKPKEGYLLDISPL